MTQIKLSGPMSDALTGAWVDGNLAYVASNTKSQTIKGLHSRGLVLKDSRVLTPEGVEAARQLGADVANLGEKGYEFGVTGPESAAEAAVVVTQGITPEMIDRAAERLLKTPEQLAQAVDLDKPEVVPNREDKRRERFSVRGAVSRWNERKRVRKMEKYGQTNFGSAAA